MTAVICYWAARFRSVEASKRKLPVTCKLLLCSNICNIWQWRGVCLDGSFSFAGFAILPSWLLNMRSLLPERLQGHSHMSSPLLYKGNYHFTPVAFNSSGIVLTVATCSPKCTKFTALIIHSLTSSQSHIMTNDMELGEIFELRTARVCRTIQNWATSTLLFRYHYFHLGGEIMLRIPVSRQPQPS